MLKRNLGKERLPGASLGGRRISSEAILKQLLTDFNEIGLVIRSVYSRNRNFTSLYTARHSNSVLKYA